MKFIATSAQSKGGKMLQFINWKMKVSIQDTRTLVGTFMAFDKHMNIVLGDCEEYRVVNSKKCTHPPGVNSFQTQVSHLI
eukprot:213626-Amorphochlora_amoeboformis.AAC.1